MSEIRAPEDADRSQIVDLMRIAFNVPPAWARHVAPGIKLDRFLGAFDGPKLVAMAQAWELTQWFGGKALPMAGIAAVAVLPERRGSGMAPEVLRTMLRQCRERGMILSTLYPSRASVYRRLGYEYAGVLTQLRIPIAELPALGSGAEHARSPESGGVGEPARPHQFGEEGEPVGSLRIKGSGEAASPRPGGLSEPIEVSAYDDSLMSEVRVCYLEVAARHNGMVDSEAADWWGMRVFRRWNPDAATRGVVVRCGGKVEAYASFQLEAITDSWGFRINCTHMIARSEAGLRGILDYFRSYRGLGQFLVWYGPANDPISLLAGGGADTIQPLRTVRFMTRILDVPAALAGRGYGPTEGRAVIAVDDGLFPENRGPFLVQARDGRLAVERVEAEPECRLSIGALSALYTGYASVSDLARAGQLSPDCPAAPLLGALFAGPMPWMTDFF